MTEIVTIGLQVYRWQSPLDVALGLMRYLNFEVSQSIATDTGAVRLWINLPVGMDVYHARMKIEEVAYPSGVSLIMESDVGVATPVPPPVPIPPAWYTTVTVGTHLKVLRPLGLQVYLDSALMGAWRRGRLPIGDTGMRVAQNYDPEKDTTPPIGVLCVLLPSPPDFPNGLWICALGNDGLPNVSAV